MKGKFKNYGLWISIVSAVLMLLQAMGLKFDLPYVNEIITSILGVLVTLGIISNPSDGSGYTDKSGDIIEKVEDEDINSDNNIWLHIFVNWNNLIFDKYLFKLLITKKVLNWFKDFLFLFINCIIIYLLFYLNQSTQSKIWSTIFWAVSLS